MDVQALRQLKPDLELFLDRYAPLFGRGEAQDHASRFVQGLLLGGDRRSVENIAEAIDGCVVRSLQKFIAQSPWSEDAILEELQRQVTEVLGDPDATLNVDETGFSKKATKSVGVKRQYAGRLGRTDNCQIGVCVNYRSAAGHTLIDRRLFLPEEGATAGHRWPPTCGPGSRRALARAAGSAAGPDADGRTGARTARLAREGQGLQPGGYAPTNGRG